MKPNPVTIKDIVSLLPKEAVDGFAKATNVDYQVKSLAGADVLYLMLYDHFEHRGQSLRQAKQTSESTLYHAFAGKPEGYRVPHSTLSDRLKAIKPEFFKSILDSLCGQVSDTYYGSGFKGRTITRYDSTVISLSSKLLRFGMRSGRKPADGKPEKHQIKFTAAFQGIACPDIDMYKEQQDISDDKPFVDIIKRHKQKGEDISVFDRGLKKREGFKSIQDAGIQFVTRINPNSRYIEIGGLAFSKNSLKDTETLEFQKDAMVNLYCSGQTEPFHAPFRLIICRSKKTGDPLYFLTNILNMPAADIAQIYALRWDIEVFFKFLKQELSLRHFISRSENGILATVYIAAIAAVMLLLYKQANGIPGYKIMKQRFFNELETEIVKIIIRQCGGDPDKLDTTKCYAGCGQ